jgi:hypothetical protein
MGLGAENREQGTGNREQGTEIRGVGVNFLSFESLFTLNAH